MAEQHGRLPPLPVVGRVVEPVYRAVISRRNARFDAGRGVQKFAAADGRAIPVVSIGNLSVGGTGKTPIVMHVVRLLLEHGHRPCVAMRGYSKSVDGAADEVDAYRRAFTGLPFHGLGIVAQADRAAGVRALIADWKEEAPDCIVLDDGFQHRQIGREMDVVLIDATPGRSVFADRCLPAGWLREPVESLRRASCVVLTHAELEGMEGNPPGTGGVPKGGIPGHIERLRAEVARVTSAPVAVTRHVWTGLDWRDEGGAEKKLPLNVLIGKTVVGCCAIGHPEGFLRSLRTVVGESGRVETLVLADHDPFGPVAVKRLRALAQGVHADYIVVTDKDWSKLRGHPAGMWPCPMVRPELAIGFDSGREEFDGMVLRAVGGGRT